MTRTGNEPRAEDSHAAMATALKALLRRRSARMCQAWPTGRRRPGQPVDVPALDHGLLADLTSIVSDALVASERLEGLAPGALDSLATSRRRRLEQLDRLSTWVAAKGTSPEQVSGLLAWIYRDAGLSSGAIQRTAYTLRMQIQSWQQRRLDSSLAMVRLDRVWAPAPSGEFASRPLCVAVASGHSGSSQLLGLWAVATPDDPHVMRSILIDLRRRGVGAVDVLACAPSPAFTLAVARTWPQAQLVGA